MIHQKYKEVLRRTASAAEECIRSSISFGDKRLSVYTLTNLPETKDIENKLSLPSSSPILTLFLQKVPDWNLELILLKNVPIWNLLEIFQK
jgi:hypothetical protein